MNVENIVRECDLAGGLKAVIHDITSHYFGGYYHVRLRVTADVPVTEAWFGSFSEYEDALRRLGPYARFCRTMEKMAVPLADVDAVRSALLHSFETNLLSYLSRPDFPCRFVMSELFKARKTMIPCGYGQS